MGSVFKDTRSGGVIWSIRYRDVDGRARRERTKALNRTVARRILSEREDAVERARLQGLPNVGALIAPKAAVTLREFAEEYRTHVDAHCGPETARRYGSHLDTHIIPQLGRMTLRSMNAGHIQKYSDGRLTEAAPRRCGRR